MSNPRTSQFPMSSPALLPQTIAESAPTSARVDKKDLKDLRGGDLYSALFEEKAFARLKKEDLSMIAERFAKNYFGSFTMIKMQMTDRLGILKALEQQASLRRSPASVPTQELLQFYGNILNNPQEHWIVKRQAFKNLNAGLSSEEREKYYHSLDTRIISLAGKSETEILEEVLGAHQ